MAFQILSSKLKKIVYVAYLLQCFLYYANEVLQKIITSLSFQRQFKYILRTFLIPCIAHFRHA